MTARASIFPDLGLLALGLLAAPPAAHAAEPLSVDGFSWAENLAFDGRGHLFVSDVVRGEVWRISPSGGTYVSELWLSGFEGVSGMVAPPDGSTVYAVGTRATASGDDTMVFSFSPEVKEVWVKLASVPNTPNGLAMDAAGFLYTTTEGGFIPGRGEVYRVDTETGAVTTLMSDLWAADGAAVDPSGWMLYIGEVVSGKVWIYDLRADQNLGFFQGLNGMRISWLDDFSFGDDPDLIFGTDFARGNVVRIPVDEDLRGPPDVLERGFAAPTSCKFGWGPGFNETSLYVTEGGGFTDSVTDRRVVEIPNAR